MRARVTVVVRTKNRSVLLARALRSIAAQTARDYVVVVVNDGGDQDDVRATVDAAQGSFGEGQVVVLHHDTSLGRSAAANAGITAAESDYFVLHDDDDSWHPGFLAATVAHLDAHPAVGGVVTPSEVVYEHLEGERIVEDRRAPMYGPREASLVELTSQNYLTTNSMLVRREAFDRVGGFDTQLPVLEDWDFNLRLLSSYPVGYLAGEPLAFWHHRETSTGDDANSVGAGASQHLALESVVREAFLRRDLERGVSGLGSQLALASLLRTISTNADGAWRQHSAVVDGWGHAQQDHLQVVHRAQQQQASETRAELTREIVSLRADVSSLQEMVTSMGVALERALDAPGRPGSDFRSRR